LSLPNPFPASDVHVTRHFSLTGETNHQKTTLQGVPVGLSDLFKHDHPNNVFCDWLSIYQHHAEKLPTFSDGFFVRFDADGEHESTTLKKLRVEGSHESAVFIRCDGQTVQFEGNVSKFGRQDNVFGYTFTQCMERINSLLASLGLPPFTTGERFEVNTPNGWRSAWTGARITRVDMTENFSTGSKENAYAFMRFAAGQQASRLKTGTYGEGETVDFGRNSRRIYSKLYLKGSELLKHARKRLTANDLETQSEFSKPFDPYIYELADWCNSSGLVRFETTYKSTFLIDAGWQYLGSINMHQLNIDFESRKEVFTRTNAEIDRISEIDQKFLATYRMWQAGDDLTSKLSRATFYRHRSALLPYGVDIAVKSNVLKFEPKTRVIKLGPCTPPPFYKLPPSTFIRLAA
jgi:hypothetical protein